MGNKNTVDSDFWVDNYLSDIDPLEKYLYLYFITNPHSNIAGAYQIPLKIISVETGIEKSAVEKMIHRFEITGKLIYKEGWVCLKNRNKYNKKDNESVKSGVLAILKKCPDFINEFLKIDQTAPSLSKGHSILYNKIVLDSTTEFLDFWNSKTYLPKITKMSESRKAHLKASLSDKYFFDNYKKELERVPESDFLSGRIKSETHKNWKFDFDFFVKPDTIIKMVENKYHANRTIDKPKQIYDDELRTINGKQYGDTDYSALKDIFKKEGIESMNKKIEKLNEVKK